MPQDPQARLSRLRAQVSALPHAPLRPPPAHLLAPPFPPRPLAGASARPVPPQALLCVPPPAVHVATPEASQPLGMPGGRAMLREGFLPWLPSRLPGPCGVPAHLQAGAAQAGPSLAMEASVQRGTLQGHGLGADAEGAAAQLSSAHDMHVTHRAQGTLAGPGLCRVQGSGLGLGAWGPSPGAAGLALPRSVPSLVGGSLRAGFAVGGVGRAV